MNDLKISLIIPAHNEEKYLGDCLAAAIKNSAGKFSEIIVVDNASTDDTRTVAEKFPGVRVVDEKQKGLTSARQGGYLAARGNILAYVDADTLPPSGWLETIISEFENDPDLACLSGPYIYYDLPRWQQFLVKLYWYMLAYPIYLAVGYMATGGNFAIRREVLEKMGGFDTSISFYGEDTNIARRARAFGLVKFKLSLAMGTSGRRLKNQGLIKMFWLYTINYLSEVIRQRPTTIAYSDIR